LRAESPQDRWFGLAAGGLALLALTSIGGLLGGSTMALVGAIAGVAAALGITRLTGRRSARRRALLRSSFPEAWRQLLLETYDHYDRLPDGLRPRFEDDLRIFVAEKRITGVGVEVTDELRLLVGASAVTLSLGWPDYEWDQVTEVLLYPQDFDRDYGFEGKELAGQAHPWGTLILSVPTLRESFADPDDGYHVGLHEFAHLLGVSQTRFEGIPPGLGPERSREWVSLAELEMSRLRRGKSVMDPYGGDDPVEFLAVAVEAFFETALALRQRHREVYAILAEYFAQDPAAWDDQRGLLL
jgi:MtfA peptidase